MNYYIVAGCRPWNRRVFERHLKDRLPGRWLYASSREELEAALSREDSPRFIFFLHWSWIVPREIWSHVECICFHMAPLPLGRGGSPLQNLILQGRHHTKLSALRMEELLDAGPIYLQEDLCLHGTAEEVYIRASTLAMGMIERIVLIQPEPQPQKGETSVFSRRKPVDSKIPALQDLDAFHDFIQMLDAEGYPHAFIDYRGFRIEFRRSARYDGRVIADAMITESGEKIP